MKGKAHIYEKEHINTDEIIPARYLNTDDIKELAKHAMEDIDKDFVKKVKEGDFIVAGQDFGCGSSREHAVWALRGAGIKAVVAKSFARIFFRNCINNGLLVIECPNATEMIKDGDEMEIDVNNGAIKNLTRNTTVNFTPIPDFAMQIIERGGLLNYILSRMK